MRDLGNVILEVNIADDCGVGVPHPPTFHIHEINQPSYYKCFVQFKVTYLLAILINILTT